MEDYPVNDGLPCWETIRRKKESGETLSALEDFILDNEPSGKDERPWRDALLAVVIEAKMNA